MAHVVDPLLEAVHGGYVHRRRVQVLCRHLAEMIPEGSRSLLDVGCGDGRLAAAVRLARPELEVSGLEVLVRPGTRIPVTAFDGRTLPFVAGSFDAVMMVDVLHHTEDPSVLLREAARVSRRWVILKDHYLQGIGASATLRLMDWVSNARYRVSLPYNYQSPARWESLFASTGLHLHAERIDLGLYPWPASWVFGRRLHFVACLGRFAEPGSRAV